MMKIALGCLLLLTVLDSTSVVLAGPCGGYGSPFPQPRTPEVCPNNEHVPPCEPCHKTCDDHIQGIFCTTDCKSTNKCFCTDGMVRNAEGVCVQTSRCELERENARQQQSTITTTVAPWKGNSHGKSLLPLIGTSWLTLESLDWSVLTFSVCVLNVQMHRLYLFHK